jgi:hypothetical protein
MSSGPPSSSPGRHGTSAWPARLCLRWIHCSTMAGLCLLRRILVIIVKRISLANCFATPGRCSCLRAPLKNSALIWRGSISRRGMDLYGCRLPNTRVLALRDLVTSPIVARMGTSNAASHCCPMCARGSTERHRRTHHSGTVARYGWTKLRQKPKYEQQRGENENNEHGATGLCGCALGVG